MRLGSTRKLHKKVGGQERTGGGGTSALVRNTSSILSLPILSTRTAPTRVTTGMHVDYWSQLALHLLLAGYINEDDRDLELISMVQVGFKKWIDQYTGDLKIFDFRIFVDVDTEHEWLDDVDRNGKKPKEIGQLYFSIDAGNLSTYTIGEKLEELEAKVPGLGSTACYWLSVTGARNLDVMTPWRAKDRAQLVWWDWQDNQEDWIESIKENDPDTTDEEIGEMIGPEDWDRNFPDWASNISDPLKETELKELADKNDGSLESMVAVVVLDLIRLVDASLPSLHGTEQESVYNGVYLIWKDGDLVNRLMDDWFEYANGGSDYMSTFFSECKIPSDAKAFRQWKAEIEQGLTQLKNIERLINLIGVQTN